MTLCGLHELVEVFQYSLHSSLQWLNNSKVGGETNAIQPTFPPLLSSSSSPSLPFRSPPINVTDRRTDGQFAVATPRYA